jgi:hypothetical protein
MDAKLAQRLTHRIKSSGPEILDDKPLGIMVGMIQKAYPAVSYRGCFRMFRNLYNEVKG